MQESGYGKLGVKFTDEEIKQFLDLEEKVFVYDDSYDKYIDWYEDHTDYSNSQIRRIVYFKPNGDPDLLPKANTESRQIMRSMIIVLTGRYLRLKEEHEQELELCVNHDKNHDVYLKSEEENFLRNKMIFTILIKAYIDDDLELAKSISNMR